MTPYLSPNFAML